MQEKYEKLFYEFKPKDTIWGDWCHSPQAYFLGDGDIPGSKLNAGFQVITAPALLEQEPHFHREDEYLVFLGAKLPDVFSVWDAEVHLFMGQTLETMEKIVITEPTIIKAPGGWWHGPLSFARVDKPVLFQAALLAGTRGPIKLMEVKEGDAQYIYSPNCIFHSHKPCNHCGYCFSNAAHLPEFPYKSVKWTVVNEDGVESYSDAGAYDPEKAPKGPDCVLYPGKKSMPYSDATKLKAPKPPLSPELAKCILACPKEENSWGDFCPSPQFYFRGVTYMEEATYHVGFQTLTAANDMEGTHIHMGAEEYVFFMGADPMNIFDFDCEIEMFFGDDPDHLESKIITKPTVVRVPPNVWHCPILFRKMNKPVLFQAAFLSGTWGTIVRAENTAPPETSDDKPFARGASYTYMGDDVRLCKFDERKRCIVCGACFPKPETYLKDE